ncbi:MAG: universal stress protein [Proteobacteria bacterium]|nr:universal stress protein [Pseudomonadota bacterium]HQR03383.1 universal stress protein [Rhodocyclaceae bacterium]
MSVIYENMTINILFAVDGSSGSLRAARTFVEHLRMLRGKPKVHMLHVHPPLPIGLAFKHLPREALDRHYQEEGEAALEKSQSLLAEAGITVISHIHVGPPAQTILQQAVTLKCSWIALGRNGHGVMSPFSLGSIAARVLQTSEIPVVLFP